jgi:hypothetical protein
MIHGASWGQDGGGAKPGVKPSACAGGAATRCLVPELRCLMKCHLVPVSF